MELTVGAILDGTVKSLTKFGAFVLLPGGSTGMVHISEVAYSFVNDIHDYLHEGDPVKVMVIAAENGKIDLSIKRTLPAPAKSVRRPAPSGDRRTPASRSETPAAAAPRSFDDMLKQFMTESDSKMSGIRQYSEHKTKTRKR